MMDLKISQMTTTPTINSDAYLPLIQLSGLDEVNYKISYPNFVTGLAIPSIVPVAPITYNSGTGDIGIDYNATNLKITSSALNTIQDIAVTSSPSFESVTVARDAATASLNIDTITGQILGITNNSPAVTVTLGATSTTALRQITIKDEAGTANSSPITIAPASGTIDGQASIQITVDWGSVNIYSDGTNWFTR